MIALLSSSQSRANTAPLSSFQPQIQPAAAVRIYTTLTEQELGINQILSPWKTPFCQWVFVKTDVKSLPEETKL